MVRHPLKILQQMLEPAFAGNGWESCSKRFQEMLQNFKIVSDHFGTLCIKWLRDVPEPFFCF